jgi:hypothetical protein
MKLKGLWIILATLACRHSPPPQTSTECEARITGYMPAELNEASGIAVSSSNPGILWVHTDDNPPVLYAIDSTGTVKGRVRIPEVENHDWEDIATGPCGHSTCLFIADIGDNAQRRERRAIYRVPEPAVNDTVAAGPIVFPFHLPGRKSHDAEALFVMPDGRMYVITKGRSGPITVFAFPHPAVANQDVELEPIATLSAGLVQVPDLVTGAASTSDGRFIAIRSYTAVQLYRLNGTQLVAVLPRPIDLRALREPQGEGIGIRDDGVMFLVSERGMSGANAPVSRVQCAGINAAQSP